MFFFKQNFRLEIKNYRQKCFLTYALLKTKVFISAKKTGFKSDYANMLLGQEATERSYKATMSKNNLELIINSQFYTYFLPYFSSASFTY